MQNIETVNITGQYVTTGLALTNVSGTKDLNLDTTLSGGIATVTDANSVNALNINAGENIATLNVTSLASGTRDTVNVDGGSANVSITGNASGADKYSVEIGTGKTLTVGTMDSAGDTLAVSASGSFTLNTDGTGANMTAAITNNSSSSITVDATETGLIAKSMTLAGGAIVLEAKDSDGVDGIAITSSAADSTIKLSDTVAATTGPIDLNKAVVNKVLVSKDVASDVIVNEATTLDLAADQGAFTVGIENAAGSMATDTKTGTLLLNVTASQTGKITANAQVDTVLITAGALANDANGNAQTITIADLTTNAATNTVVFNGENNAILSLFTATGGDETIVATGMSGNLTINDFSGNTKVYGGTGNDTFKTGTAADLEIHGGAGNDTIDLTNANASKAYGGAGDDKITTSGNADTIDAGDGDDSVTLGGAAAATITLGSGSDTLVMGSGKDGATVTDFAKGTDTLVLTGAGAGIDLTKLTAPTAGAYTLDGSGNFDITLTGSTATDLSDSIQLGVSSDEYDITATGGNSLTVVGGSKNDFIKVITTLTGDTDANTVSLKTGLGSDTVVISGVTGDGTDATTLTISDFVSGTDKIVLEGTADAALNLTAVSVATGVLDLAGFDVTLNNNSAAVYADGTKDVSADVQLGSSNAVFTAFAGSSVTGGKFNDYIALAGGAETVNFIDNGGFDTITSFTGGTDKLSFDAMTGITATAGTLVTGVTNAANGAVYVMNDNTTVNSDTVDFSKIGTKVNNATVKVTDSAIMDDVAAYINGALDKVVDGEKYVVVMNDNSNADIESYVYLVSADADGIQADNLTLIGHVDGNIALVAADIA